MANLPEFERDSDPSAKTGQIEKKPVLTGLGSRGNPDLQRLIGIVREISRQRDYPRLFRLVVEEIVSILGAEGGTLYLHDKNDKSLQAVIVLNSVLDLQHVITSYQPGRIKGLFGIDLAGKHHSAAGTCWSRKSIVYVKDTASETEFELSGMRSFDKEYDYSTESLVAVPLLSRDGEAIGVVQAINVNSQRMSDPSLFGLAEAVSAIMGMALKNKLLLQDTENLLHSVVEMIADTIDEKSKTTSGHCARVTELTIMIVRAMSASSEGDFRDFSVTEAELDEIRIAAQLHDIGKIAIPDIVLEKHKKLETIFDRIELVRGRFATRRAELRVAQLEKTLREAGLPVPDDPASLNGDDERDVEFLGNLNRGSENIEEHSLMRLKKIARREVADGRLISEDELKNLMVSRGTLNNDEIGIMRRHALISIRLLERLPWPAALANVPEIAGKHHENLDGSGYPYGLKEDCMSLPARILSIADRFEGISAIDRGYRKRKKLSEVMEILDFMCADGQIDKKLYRFFVDNGLHIVYARKHLPAELVDIG